MVAFLPIFTLPVTIIDRKWCRLSRPVPGDVQVLEVVVAQHGKRVPFLNNLRVHGEIALHPLDACALDEIQQPHDVVLRHVADLHCDDVHEKVEVVTGRDFVEEGDPLDVKVVTKVEVNVSRSGPVFPGGEEHGVQRLLETLVPQDEPCRTGLEGTWWW